MNIDRRVTSQSGIEVRQEGEQSRLVGYAAKFNTLSDDLGGFVERINRNAFSESLAENPDVSARIQHQGGLSTIGRTKNGTLKLSVDEVGLRYEVMVPGTTAGRDILTLVKNGFIDKSSFAFSLRENGDRWDFSTNPPTRELLNVTLRDIAPVDGPAYQDTSVAVRSMEEARKAQKLPVESSLEQNKKALDNLLKTAELRDIHIEREDIDVTNRNTANGFREFVPGPETKVALTFREIETPEPKTEPKPEPTIAERIADLKAWYRKHRK